MEKEMTAVEALRKFFDWKKEMIEKIVAEFGRLKEKFVDRELGFHCYCFHRDVYGDSSFPHFQICEIHSQEFSINKTLFSLFTYKELEAGLLSAELRKELADMLFLRKKIYLPKSFNLGTLSRIAQEEFPGVPSDQIKFVCEAYAQHYDYGMGSAGAKCYLTLSA